MYKVAIVDDEEAIVRGLTKVLPWEKYGCEIVGTASDSVSAENLIREKTPDILFTDIRMPGKDGLQMLAGIRSEFPNMKVTVLSGFSEFEYAREAIRLGVVRYLCKPSKIGELIEALETMTADAGNAEEACGGDADTQEDVNSFNFVVNTAVNYIEQHFAEKVTLSEVASICYVSQWHLSKLLSKYKGQSFYDIVNSTRIERAKKLLRDPALKIGMVADMVGYIDAPHFSRVFKKIVGMSAADYRNSQIDVKPKGRK